MRCSGLRCRPIAAFTTLVAVRPWRTPCVYLATDYLGDYTEREPMLFWQLLKETKCTRPTLDRYVRLGLIPFVENPSNGFRKFPKEAIDRVELIRTLTKRPFKRDLEEIRNIFQRVPIPQLVAEKEISISHLLQFLNENNLL